MNNYFDELAARLAARDVAPDRSRALLEELSAYTADSGLDPEEEFGPVGEFAASLAPSEEDGDEGGGEEMLWTADAFEAPARLNAFGAQGWDMERVDRLGRFVGHRDRENPQTWEYRQEMCANRADRERLAARLAPEGWEMCGHWSVLAYFKRPGAATVGPKAQLEELPEPGPRRAFYGVRGVLVIAASLLVLVVVGGATVHRAINGQTSFADPGELAGFVVGLLVGAGLALGAFWGAARLIRTVRDRR